MTVTVTLFDFTTRAALSSQTRLKAAILAAWRNYAPKELLLQSL